MKGKLLSLNEIIKLPDETKLVIYGEHYKFIGTIDTIDNKRILLGNKGEYLTFLDNAESKDYISKYKIYEWIKNNNKFEKEIDNRKDFFKTIPEIYYGDEILKMIREGKLKEGQKFNLYYNNIKQVNVIVELNNENMLVYSDDKKTPIKSSDLLIFKFKPIEKEYFTFDEAVKIGENFKYYTWSAYLPLIDVIFEIKDINEDRLEEMFKEKLWEVEA